MRLIEIFKTDKAIFYANKKDIMRLNIIDEETCNNILDIQIKKSVKNHLKYMQIHNIDIISIRNKEYPSYLREIYGAPICLYIKGNKNIFNNIGIGVIGCRDCSDYGKKIAQQFSYHLASNNVNIISGLAKGIDSCAHWGALYGKGITTAVLGSGIDIIYPKENYHLANKILKSNGAIISEYPLGTEPNKINFPARNRIISGISNGILVVEAKRKSGTLITTDFALDQGREVFVIPRKY